ncbi:MAG: hypothetical protein ACK4KW_15260, partial [Gemmobacter sp.]
EKAEAGAEAAQATPAAAAASVAPSQAQTGGAQAVAAAPGTPVAESDAEEEQGGWVLAPEEAALARQDMLVFATADVPAKAGFMLEAALCRALARVLLVLSRAFVGPSGSEQVQRAGALEEVIRR